MSLNCIFSLNDFESSHSSVNTFLLAQCKSKIGALYLWQTDVINLIGMCFESSCKDFLFLFTYWRGPVYLNFERKLNTTPRGTHCTWVKSNTHAMALLFSDILTQSLLKSDGHLNKKNTCILWHDLLTIIKEWHLTFVDAHTTLQLVTH